MESIYLAAYWKARPESRDECAEKISDFLRAAASTDDSLKEWFLKGAQRSEARKSAKLFKVGIGPLLRTNNRETTGEPMLDLGFNLSLWNGRNGSFSITIGSTNRWIENCALLKFHGECVMPKSKWILLMNAAVHSFQPDSAVVTSDAESWPLKDVAWLKYSSVNGITESELRCE